MLPRLAISYRTGKSLRDRLCLLVCICLISGFSGLSGSTGPSNAPPQDSPHLATSWLEIRSLTDSDLTKISSGANSISDHITARALLTQAERHINRSFPSALAQLNAAYRVIEPASDEAAFANAIACQLANRQGELESHKQCLQLNSLGYTVGSSVVRAFIEYTKALYLAREGQHDIAEEHIQHAGQLADASTDPALIAATKNWAGVRYHDQGLPQLALLQYESAWNHAEHAPAQELKQIIKFNMAAVYAELDRHDEALDIFEEALFWPMINVNQTRRVVARSVMAPSLIATNQANRAEQLLLEVIPNQLDKTKSDVVLQAYSSLAQTQIAQGQLDFAIINFEKSLALLAQNDSPRGNAVKVPYAGALRQAGRREEARAILEGVINELDVDNANELLVDALHELAATHEALGNVTAAAQARAQAATIDNELNSMAIEYQLSRIQNAIELDNRERAIELAKERAATMETIANKESALRYVSLVLAGLLLAVVYLVFSRRLQNEVVAAERAAKESLEAQVKSRTQELEAQMADRLDAEIERRHLLSKLADGEKMRALGRLTAGVAHDFNNLMTAVTLTTEYLKNDDGKNEQKRETLLDDILSATDSAARITGGLLAYARQQPLKPKNVQLDEFLEESELIFSNTLGERNLLRTSYVPCNVIVDQGQLASALLNLLLNAREALGERGTVEISLTLEQDPGGHQADQIAVISVRDSGIGMSADELKRATEPFFTTKAAGEGNGLGLSMVYGFAHQSGGALRLRSEQGKGTTVRVELPAVTAAVTRSETPYAIQNRSLPKHMRVLIVEDRESVREILKRSLEQMGLHADTTNNAAEALAHITECGIPDLVISDIEMPGELDGNQLARMLRVHHPNLPLVMMSGYSNRVAEGYEFLSKPFTNERLEKAILGALGRVAVTPLKGAHSLRSATRA